MLCEAGIHKTSHKPLLGYFSYEVGCEEPYDADEHPVLLEEDEIIKLLGQRKLAGKASGDGDGGEKYISLEDILTALKNAGIDIPEDADYETYPRTEKEGERINLAHFILQLDGINPRGCGKVRCPYCESEMIAALGYTVRGDNYKELAKGVHAPTDKEALVYNGLGVIDYGVSKSRNGKHPAYICLRCGAEFGKLELPKELEQLYKGQPVKKGAVKSKRVWHMP